MAVSERASPAARSPYRTRERVVTLPGGVSVTCLEISDVDALLERAIDEGSPAPYGAVLWASGVALAERLQGRLRERGSFAGVRVLDVGAGTGLPSLVAARLGADVTAVDHDPVARSLLQEAAERQRLSLSVRELDLYGEEPLPDADLVLFADLLYERPLALAAARRVLEAHARGSEVLVADPGRAFREVFLQALASGGVSASFEDTLVNVPGDEQQQRVGVLVLAGARA